MLSQSLPPAQSPSTASASKRAASSVPSSPTTKNPALRSSKGAFPGGTSPRKPSSGSAPTPCSCQHSGVPIIDKPSPTGGGASFGRGKAVWGWVEYANALVSRPLLWVCVLLFSNYMGHFHPFLWRAADRAALLQVIAKPLTSSYSGSPRPHALRSLFAASSQFPALSQVALGLPASSQVGQGLQSGGLQPRGAMNLIAMGDPIERVPAVTATPSSSAVSTTVSTTVSAATGGGGGVTDSSGSEAAKEGGQALGMSDDALLNGNEANEEASQVLPTELENDQPGMDKHHQETGRDVLAVPITGTQNQSPYVTPWAISLQRQASCRKIYPRHLVFPSQGPISFVGDLLRKHQRLLLTIPRHGLGNSLRGYVSSFVYAALSGRRLVRFHGAEHAKVFDTLCHSFRCGFDAIQTDEVSGGAMGLYKQLEMLNPVDLNSKFRASAQKLTSLRSTWTLFVTKSPHFFDGFWHNFPQVRQCIYDAFGCSSAWCVRSRAMQALVGAPTPLLEEVVDKVLKVHQGAGKPDVPAHRDINAMFDIALHFRTRPTAIESKHPGEEGQGEAMMKIGCGLNEKTAEASQYLKSCLWDCLGSIIAKLEAARTTKGAPLQILLATDNEQLRPAFAERLSKYGTVYYSSGVIVHSSKSASDEAERLPTMAEFHLMSRSHTILEAGSYISTFAYFSGLLGNGTLAGIDWHSQGGCGLKYIHKGEMVKKQIQHQQH